MAGEQAVESEGNTAKLAAAREAMALQRRAPLGRRRRQEATTALLAVISDDDGEDGEDDAD